MKRPHLAPFRARRLDLQVFCALPQTLNEFLADLQSGPRQRLAATHVRLQAARGSTASPQALWSHLENGDIGALERGLRRAEARGADVSRGVTFERFRPGVEARAVVLIAHSCDGWVEFRDGMRPPREVAERFPAEFGGAIDLSLCHSFALHDAIREHCGVKARIVTSDTPATLGIRVAVCVLALELMHEREMAYHDAVATVVALSRPPLDDQERET